MSQRPESDEDEVMLSDPGSDEESRLFEATSNQFRGGGAIPACLTPPPFQDACADRIEASISQLSLVGKPPRSPSPVLRRNDEEPTSERDAPLRRATGAPLSRYLKSPEVNRALRYDDDETLEESRRQAPGDGYETPVDCARRGPRGQSETLKRSAGALRRSCDEWREAVDAESGDSYYYNRRTRRASWELPAGAVVVKNPNGNRETIFAPRDPSPSAVEVLARRVARTKPRAAAAAAAAPLETTNRDDPDQPKKTLARLKMRVARRRREAAPVSTSPRDARGGRDDEHNANAAPLRQKPLAPNPKKEREVFNENAPAQPRIYCAYCGEVLYVNQLATHLVDDCAARERISRTPTDIELQTVLRRAWGDQAATTPRKKILAPSKTNRAPTRSRAIKHPHLCATVTPP
ncbi:hypothetical protein CTAYLR_006073 [Chrysophaeum taylorii]|uniref:WW domain-containing protein n=1 Tax=Chrysophaeum taylorii TaxID=2483200 RepID=A0AAD7XSB0_9STRA|nr:hypothetical protein CTAYLR_006073 [Chrysophaeum taylorii]